MTVVSNKIALALMNFLLTIGSDEFRTDFPPCSGRQ